MSDELKATGSCSGDCSSCGSDCGSDIDLDQPTVTLTLDDDTEVTCAVINIFPAGDRRYIALLPLNENGQNEEGEVYLYRFYEDDKGNPNLENIESDEEYELAAEAFDEMMDAAEVDEIEETEQ